MDYDQSNQLSLIYLIYEMTVDVVDMNGNIIVDMNGIMPDYHWLLYSYEKLQDGKSTLYNS